VDNEAPVPSAAPGSPPAEPAELSLADHEAQFSTKSDRDAPAPGGEVTASDVATGDEAEPPGAGAGERGPDGKFTKRARTAQATPEDVPRIRELTRKLRERESELESLRRPAAATPPRATPAPALSPQAPAQAPRLQWYIDQLRPDEDYNLAVERHAEAIANWTWQKREQQQQQQHAERQFAQTFTQKVQGARDRYQDFDEVALHAPSAIPQGSLIDRWVWEHKTGADVLYYFQKHPDELPRVLSLPALDQLETLALLSQRFVAQPPRGAAGGTGSTATPVKSQQVPRPPNPVRTGPMRGGDEPPGDDASLAAHEQFYYGSKSRRA
jgi:hypothetical protein